jgi:hypothetical protein
MTDAPADWLCTGDSITKAAVTVFTSLTFGLAGVVIWPPPFATSHVPVAPIPVAGTPL